jgi:hypothetical protein
MSEFTTGVAKSTFFPPLCLWCEHFDMDFGSDGSLGYSEWTPGSPGSAGSLRCAKRHWVWCGEYDNYREKILSAVNCPDFTVNENVLREINDAAGKPIKLKKGKK